MWTDTADLAELRTALTRIELRHAAIRTTLHVTENRQLLITVFSLDRDLGTKIRVDHFFAIPPGLTQDRFLRFVEQRVSGAWLHELEEAFHLDGQRLRDPHRDPRALTSYCVAIYGDAPIP